MNIIKITYIIIGIRSSVVKTFFISIFLSIKILLHHIHAHEYGNKIGIFSTNGYLFAIYDLLGKSDEIKLANLDFFCLF